MGRAMIDTFCICRVQIENLIKAYPFKNQLQFILSLSFSKIEERAQGTQYSDNIYGKII